MARAAFSKFVVSLNSLAELPPVIPREVQFGNPERVSHNSPGGRRPARVALLTNNLLQIRVGIPGRNDDRIVTADPRRAIRTSTGAGDSHTLRCPWDPTKSRTFKLTA
ncbi:MAG: hypothetical protein WHT82_04450 [Limisphaera sp.]